MQSKQGDIQHKTSTKIYKKAIEQLTSRIIDEIEGSNTR